MPPQVSLQPGSTNTAAVKQLQDWLVQNGYMLPSEVGTGYGTYGPKTTAAVVKAQQALKVDNSTGPGFWGPRTIAKVTGSGTGGQPQSQAELDAQYEKAVASHPAFGGDQPFSAADQAAAEKQGTADVTPYFTAEQNKETADTESALASKEATYGNFLNTEATNFQKDKTALDQNAADNGILFSGSRIQKQKALESAYGANQDYNQGQTGRDLADTARAYGYKYGDAAANKLSSYYNLPGNAYNAGVATGGVKPAGLSSFYNPDQGFQGTQVNVAKTEAQKRAAALLANKGNKLLMSGYSNQL